MSKITPAHAGNKTQHLLAEKASMTPPWSTCLKEAVIKMRHTVPCQVKHEPGSYGLIGSDIGSITNQQRDLLLRKKARIC